jgi:hypothetical protein
MRWVALAGFFVFFVRGGLGVEAPDVLAGEACKLATKGDSPVAKACQEGGAEAAKEIMRKMRSKVNGGGGRRINCKDCHDHDADERYDTLTKDGRERFKAFLASYEKNK